MQIPNRTRKDKGYKLKMNEAEVNTLPLDLKLVHYEMHSKVIAECVLNYKNKGAVHHSNIVVVA